MFLLLFFLWLLLNGRVTAEVVAFGLVLSALLMAFARRFCGWTAARERRWLRVLGRLAVYFAHLCAEIVRSNLAVMRVILSPSLGGVQPQLFFFDSHLDTDAGRTLLANSITITPGTYTVGVYGSTLAVHALNPAFKAGTPDSTCGRRLLAMEAALKKEDAQ